MAIFGSVQITGFIAPTSSGDTYATHDAYYGRDGLRNVDTEAELDQITSLRRKAGMIVGVSGGTKHYRLLPEPWSFTFSDWATAFVTPNDIDSYGLGNRWYVPSDITVTIQNDFQTFIYGDLIVAGTIDTQTNGQLVVLNGNLIMSGGTIIGSGTTSVIQIPDFDTKISAFTFNNSTYDLTITQNDNTYFTTNIGIVAGDVRVTGGTYDSNTGTATFYNNSGGSFTVTGFLTGYTDNYVTGGTYNDLTTSIDFVGTSNFPPFSVDLTNALSLSAVTSVGSTTTTDIEIADSTKGVILRSPDNTRWRVTVDNSGSLITTIVP